jgi:hypothetical protein
VAFEEKTQMAELDNLLGSKISLISQQDVRYEGILFSINQNESSIVLQNGLMIPPLPSVSHLFI